MLGKFADWLLKPFVWLLTHIVALVTWLLDALYNAILSMAEFLFEWMIDILVFFIGLLPTTDLSAFDDGFSYVVDYYKSINTFLPLSELFVCIGFLLFYYLVFTVIRLIIKLIPGIG